MNSGTVPIVTVTDAAVTLLAGTYENWRGLPFDVIIENLLPIAGFISYDGGATYGHLAPGLYAEKITFYTPVVNIMVKRIAGGPLNLGGLWAKTAP